MIQSWWKFLLLCSAIPLAEHGSASGALFPTNEFATKVVQYTQGSVASYDTQYGDTADWTGIPTGGTGAYEGDYGQVTPFFPPFDPNQILLIGNGGHLTLQFPNAVTVGSSSLLGVFSTAGFVDANGLGTVGPTAATFGGGMTTVKVSQDGINWISLGVKNINMPQAYYRNAGPYDVIAPSNPILSDYGLPYTGSISAFDNESNSQVLTTLNGSAGGTWLDVSSTGLSQINYIDFSPPTNASSTWQLAIEAVSTAAPTVVPEPTVMGSVISLMFFLRRRRNQ